MGFFKKLTKGFNFLTGMPKKGTALGKLNNIATGGLSNAMQSRRGQSVLTGGISNALQSNRGRQIIGSMGAQMMGLDPALGAGAAQAMQERRLNNQLGEAIEPIERMQIDPRQFMPQPAAEPQQFNPMQKPGFAPQPMQKPGMSPQLGVIRPEMQEQPQGGGMNHQGGGFGGGAGMPAQPQGGGSWRDPRMQKLFGRQQPGPRY